VTVAAGAASEARRVPGKRATVDVPAPGDELTSSVPRASSARSRIPVRPKPVAVA
jgi:hypothetical protein